MSYPGWDPTARTWAEIHLDRLSHNYHQLRALTGAKFLGIVKANAYGHGAIPVARHLQALGADYLAVACLDEAMALRQAGISLPILLLSQVDPRYASLLAEQNLTATIASAEMAHAMSDALCGQTLRCHLKLDTGMSRLGFLCDELSFNTTLDTLRGLRDLPGLEWEGVYSHFSDADGSDPYSYFQLIRFQRMAHALSSCGYTFSLRHCAASAATLNYIADAAMDMIRPGILLYGCYPDVSLRNRLDLHPVMELHTRVVSVKDLPAGTPVSYGRTFTTHRNTRIAAVAVGYGDGLFRSLSGKQEMLIRGRRVPQLGRVCMDMCMLDITDHPEVAVGDDVTVFGEALPIEEKSDAAGTIPYELLCAVSQRVHRVYL